MAEPLRVLMVMSEAVPYAKTGGLADVAGALPAALVDLGCEVRAIMPRYRQVKSDAHGLERIIPFERTTWAGVEVERAVWRKTAAGVEWYFIDAPYYYDRDQLYTVAGKDYPDNFERFAWFDQQVLALIRRLDWKPDVIHCHDWQSGLVPPYLKLPAQTSLIDTSDPFYRDIRTLFTIHNIAYQGLFPKEKYPLTGFDESHFTWTDLEYWGKMNFLKAGLVYADRLSTVSRRYAEEIQTTEFGAGLDGVLAWRKDVLTGILNGIDANDWNPATDPHIAANYTADDLAGKDVCRRTLLAAQKLAVETDAPLIGMIGRLDKQKGYDLVEAAIEDIMALGVRMVVLGTGDPRYHEMFAEMAKEYPDRLAVNLKFDNALARQIEAGSDMFLMPSKFEPCGLNQMYSLRYGTVPIVHATGGLADTIGDYDMATGAGNGFSFATYTPTAMLDAVKRAVLVWQDTSRWLDLMRTGMRQDFSWDKSARQYRDLYAAMKG